MQNREMRPMIEGQDVDINEVMDILNEAEERLTNLLSRRENRVFTMKEMGALGEAYRTVMGDIEAGRAPTKGLRAHYPEQVAEAAIRGITHAAVHHSIASLALLFNILIPLC